MLCLLACVTLPARPYSVLSHEEVVDLAWKSHVLPLLRERYPAATPDELREAHSYAYGGCILQDLGYYPFGNHELSDLAHYVRTGDFVNNMLRDANSMDEYAFALGALAHYRGDTTGHPAVGVATAREYPRLKRRFGPFVSYYDSPKAHIRTEFGFDVVQVAQGHYVKDNYASFIGFNVSTPLMERAFQDTYGIPLKTVLKHEGLAVNTFRYSVSTVIPEMTRVAVLHYGQEIQEKVPTFDRETFVYRMTRADYEREYGKQYRRPGIGAHILDAILKIMPKFGPFSALHLEMPNAADQKLYLDSMQATLHLYSKDMDALRAQPKPHGTLPLKNLDYDTGKDTRLKEYPLADATYAKLLQQVTHTKDAEISDSLRENILEYYAPLQHHGYSYASAVLHYRREKKQRELFANLRRLREQTPTVKTAAMAAPREP